jgi:hypothetical protein
MAHRISRTSDFLNPPFTILYLLPTHPTKPSPVQPAVASAIGSFVPFPYLKRAPWRTASPHSARLRGPAQPQTLPLPLPFPSPRCARVDLTLLQGPRHTNQSDGKRGGLHPRNRTNSNRNRTSHTRLHPTRHGMHFHPWKLELATLLLSITRKVPHPTD